MFGLSFYSGEMNDLVAQLIQPLSKDDPVQLLVTTNIDHIVKLKSNLLFRQAYNFAAIRTIDGMPLLWYANSNAKTKLQRITGSDLLPLIIQRLDPKITRPFFMVAEKSIAIFLTKKLHLLGFNSNDFNIFVPEFGFENDAEANKKICEKIHELNSTHVFLGLGAPKSEIWVHQNRLSLKSTKVLCVGAAFHFYAERIARAPKYWQKLGLEWLWRFGVEPKRVFRRYFIDSWLILPVFLGCYDFSIKTGSNSNE